MNKSEHTLAVSGARKICGNGGCCQPYDCGHTNKRRIGVPPLIGSETVCPLAKYNIEPSSDTCPVWLRPFSETHVTKDEIWALCAECQHSEMAEKDGQPLLVRRDYRSACLDCPVKAVEESIAECEAEGQSQ